MTNMNAPCSFQQKVNVDRTIELWGYKSDSRGITNVGPLNQILEVSIMWNL